MFDVLPERLFFSSGEQGKLPHVPNILDHEAGRFRLGLAQGGLRLGLIFYRDRVPVRGWPGCPAV
jgi:hypothetical protein